jgi:hypothetical protein
MVEFLKLITCLNRHILRLKGADYCTGDILRLDLPLRPRKHIDLGKDFDAFLSTILRFRNALIRTYADIWERLQLAKPYRKRDLGSG